MTTRVTVDSIALDFNAATERGYWKATVGGSFASPVVYFKSRSSMIELAYDPSSRRFTVLFNRLNCAFGDYMAGIHKAISGVLAALKASGHDVGVPMNSTDGLVRLEFNPKTKTTYVVIADISDDWLTAFKAEEDAA